jgi:flavin reductase (DIM6/NTAB) family NADH-FMN oxidoreductase RutF
MEGSSPTGSVELERAVAAVDGARFRQALGKFPTGVAILTASAPDGHMVGLTVSSFNSVSLSPPLVLWSITRTTPSFGVFREAPFFCANVLSEQQEELARHFARPHAEKFAGVRHVRHDETGVPVLADCAAHLVCRSWNQYDGGDHLILVGQVVDLGLNDRRPLVFGLGQFCRLSSDPTSQR